MSAEEDLFRAVPFGRQMRNTHFLFSPSYTPLNHGSFGAYPRAVQERLRQCQDIAESRPDAFFRHHRPELLDASREAIASYLRVPTPDIVLVPNASTATNVVLRSLKFEENDVVVFFKTAYGAVQKTVEYLRETTPLEKVVISLTYPMSHEDVVELFRRGVQDARRRGKRVRAALLDTISSMPGVCIPWERLVRICKDENILSVIDGAHSVGQISIDLQKVQPDFFTSNLHKWLFVPRATAVFYVPERNQHMIRTSLPTSHGFDPLPEEGAEKILNPLVMGDKSPFVLLFEFVATTDSSPYFCIEQALKFRQEACGGEEKIMEYCRIISDEGGRRAAEILGTEVMENSEASLSQSAFSNVRLPLKLGKEKGQIPEENAVNAVGWIAIHLIEDYDVYASVYLHAGNIWVRFSGQIYLDLEDFTNGARALKALCERVPHVTFP